MKRFLKSIYFIPSLWVAWVVYYYTRLKIRDSLVLTDPKTGSRIIYEWHSTQPGAARELVLAAPDVFGDALHGFLTLVTLIWIALGATKLVIRFFVRTVHEEKQRVKEEGK
jgi:hypothetical protein